MHHLLLGTPLHYDELRVFWLPLLPNITPTMPHKLSPRSMACIFLGYPSDHRGYRCYDIETRRVYTLRHVSFIEHVFPFRDTKASSAQPLATYNVDDAAVPTTPPAPRPGRHATMTAPVRSPPHHHRRSPLAPCWHLRRYFRPCQRPVPRRRPSPPSCPHQRRHHNITC